MSELHVIFGSGPLGRYTAENLLSLGKAVRLINRSGKMDSAPAGVEVRKADALHAAEIAPLLAGARTVYQCAQPPYHRWAQDFPPLQDAILKAAAGCGARLVVAENLYMYGMPGAAPFSERSRYQPCSRKGQVRLAMTQALFAAHAQGKLAVAAVRGSDFFGPWEPINGAGIFAAALQHKTVNMLGSMDVARSFTYVRDFGRALATAGTDERALGKAWHVPSGPPLTQRQLLALLSSQLGYEVKGRAVGKVLLSLVGLFNPAAREVKEMLYQFVHPFVIDGSAMEHTFGLVPTAMEQRIAETLEWVKSR